MAVEEEHKAGFGIYKMMGWKRHNKCSLHGHYFRNNKCLDCGLTFEEYSKRVGLKEAR